MLVGSCYVCSAPAMFICVVCGRNVCIECYSKSTRFCINCHKKITGESPGDSSPFKPTEFENGDEVHHETEDDEAY